MAKLVPLINIRDIHFSSRIYNHLVHTETVANWWKWKPLCVQFDSWCSCGEVSCPVESIVMLVFGKKGGLHSRLQRKWTPKVGTYCTWPGVEVMQIEFLFGCLAVSSGILFFAFLLKRWVNAITHWLKWEELFVWQGITMLILCLFWKARVV